MITPHDLNTKFIKALQESWGYILNEAGDTWTEREQQAAENEYKKAVESGDKDKIKRWEMTAKYGRQWIGRRVADCSGLFYWAFKQLGGYMYHGSNTMWSKYTTAKGELSKGRRTDGKPLKPGTALFKVKDDTDYYHVGLYVGDEMVIEAQGTKTGVTTSRPSAWHAWGELKGVDYGEDSKQDGGAKPMEYKDAVVAADGGVNLRSSASTSSIKLAVIPKGAKIQAAQFNETWSKVEYNGKSGYAMTEFIRYTDDESMNDDAIKLVESIEKELAQLKAMLQA